MIWYSTGMIVNVRKGTSVTPELTVEIYILMVTDNLFGCVYWDGRVDGTLVSGIMTM